MLLICNVEPILFQSIAIGYKRAHPASVVSVFANDPRPSLRIKTSDSSSQSFKRYGFVDAIQELDPAGALGLLDPDCKVRFLVFNLSCVCILWFSIVLIILLPIYSPHFIFQIAYRTAADKFPGKLSELFLVLSDTSPPIQVLACLRVVFGFSRVVLSLQSLVSCYSACLAFVFK